ncbi:MAG: putative exported protein [Pseudomonadota bacterium]|jgi:hypothetical protein
MNSNKLKRKLMLRRISAGTTPLSISHQTPIWMRLLLTFIGLAFAAATGVWLYEQGANFAGFNKTTVYQELEQLRTDNKKLVADYDRLTRINISAESSLMIEKSTAKQVLAHNQNLETENAQLKEELHFFETLLPASGSIKAINIRNLQGQLDKVNNQLNVRLLVMQNGKQVNNFVGKLQFTITGTNAGQPMTINYPATGNSTDTQLNFNRYQRIELNIPISLANLPLEDTQINSLQVRVLSGGVVKAQAAGTVLQSVAALQ